MFLYSVYAYKTNFWKIFYFFLLLHWFEIKYSILEIMNTTSNESNALDEMECASVDLGKYHI